MEYSLRAATDADYDFLYALHVATLRDAVEATWGWDDAAQQAMFRDRWGSGQREIVVLDGEDAGVVAVDRGDSGVFLNLTAIHPRHQRRGVGTRIIRDLIDDTHDRGLPLTLRVLKANPAARRLYHRL
ncbi:GNAT family N-acetyltransferase, partial [Candidatus Poribacteria bacterium]|nr:GNAT family N-acetyltransferase [Candidatus Poribacteria bacterium]